MLKLLIAEDEALERRALKYLITEHYRGQAIELYEAANGRAAVELALERMPEILLIDINMPVIDGLKASEIIKAQCPEVEIIILTAFSQFKYAQKAIQIGVKDYLLKPIGNEDLFNTLDSVIKKVEEKQTNLRRVDILRAGIKQMLPFYEREVIYHLAMGNASWLDNFYACRRLLDIEGHDYTCMVFKGQWEEKIEKIIGLTKTKLQFLSTIIIGNVILDEMILLVFHKGLPQSDLYQRLKGLMAELVLQVKERYGIELYGGLSTIHQPSSMAHESYREAKAMAETQQKQKQPLQQVDHLVIIYQLEKKIFNSLINENLSQALKELDSLLKVLIEQKQRIPSIKAYIEELNVVMKRNVVQFYGKALEGLEDLRLQTDMKCIDNVEKIMGLMERRFQGIINEIKNYKRDHGTQLVETIKEYVMEHYQKEVSLNEVAQHIGLSPYYLSKLFKKIEGENYKDYVIRIRMERAKELLRKKKSIKETALEVGYTDPNYFSRAFKKHTGLSATEFTKL